MRKELLKRLRKSRYTDAAAIDKLLGILRGNIPAIKELWKRIAVAALERGKLSQFLYGAFISIYAENFYSKENTYRYSTVDEDINAYVRLAAKSNQLYGWVRNNRKQASRKNLRVGFILEGFDNKQASIRTYYPFAQYHGNRTVFFYSRHPLMDGYENLVNDFKGYLCNVRYPEAQLSPMDQVKFLAESIIHDEIDILVYQTCYFVPVYNFLSCLHPAPFQAAVGHQQPEHSQEIDLLFCTPRMSLETECAVESFPMAITKAWDGAIKSRDELGVPKSAILLVTATRSSKYKQRAYWQEVEKLIDGNVYYMPVGLESADGLVKDTSHIITVGFQKDVMPYLAAGDIYLDTFPLGTGAGVIEAMQTGIPAVTMLPDFIQDFRVDNEQMAYLYVDNKALITANTDEWLKAVNTLICNESLRLRLGAEMAEKVKAYEPKKVSDWFYEKLETHYENSLNRSQYTGAQQVR